MENKKLSFSERIKQASKGKWIKFGIMTLLCLLFILWSDYYIVLLLIALFFDSYITKYIPWGWWKKSENKHFRKVMEWVDAIVFALAVAYVVTTFLFQNYQIPSSSLEKSLLVGDFLCVSKVSFGARSPMTPFSFPLVQHTLPFFDCKSYLEKPQVEYKRLKGTGQVQRNDIVVFNYPSGDTVALNQQNSDYYAIVASAGRDVVWNDKARFGNIVYRPVDRRENYVKRCIGLPGEKIALSNDTVFINGKPIAEPKDAQHLYYIQTDGTAIASNVFDEMGVSDEDEAKTKYCETLSFMGNDTLGLSYLGLKYVNGKAGAIYPNVTLTKEMVQTLSKKPFVWAVIKQNKIFKEVIQRGYKFEENPPVYPVWYKRPYSPGDFAEMWIPKRGETITFDKDIDYKVAVYERCIKNYEHNDFRYEGGKVYINGQQVSSYTFNYDYYFMMGDNRDNSADSRAWGFVPEDHIVGKPMFVWLSLDKDKGWFNGKIRWNRLFTSAAKE